jgi:hypothetical protein
MDTWGWYHALTRDLNAAGHQQVVGELESFVGCVFNDDIELMRPMETSLLRFADEIDNPWLAVFVRHWMLQGRILHRNEGASALTDAVSALELAHRPEAIGCPQSVCTTQDLSLCYGRVDGPGWANERLAVVDEALGRIDATWSCSGCLHIEKAGALADLGRLNEAGAVLDSYLGEQQAMGLDVTDHERSSLAAGYIEAGWHEAALGQMDGLRVDRMKPDAVAALTIRRARSSMVLGRDPELPGVLDLSRFGRLHDEWALLVEEMVTGGYLANDGALGATIRGVAESALNTGAYRIAFDTALRHVRLAVGRGAGWTASRGLELAERCQTYLRFPDSVADELVAARALVAQGESPSLPGEASELVDHLTSADPPVDLETQAAWLSAAIDVRADDEDLLMRWSQIAAHVGGSTAVTGELGFRLALDPSNTAVAGMYLSALMVGSGRRDGFEELAVLVADAQPTMACWARALGADRAGDPDAVRRHCADLLAIDDTALNTRRLSAASAAKVGDYDDAARLMREVCDRTDAPGNDEWLLVEYATFANDWTTVRCAGGRLGMVFQSSEGPVDEEWGYVWIRPLAGSDNGSDDLQAIRTGPVTARVSTVTSPDTGRQRRGDVVVFDAKPIDQQPLEGEPGHDDWNPSFCEQAVISEGRMQAWPVFGIDPGDGWRDAAAMFFAKGWMLWRSTAPGRMIEDDEGNRTPGVYGLLAVPRDVDAALASASLHAITRDWDGTVVWPDLAQEVADAATSTTTSTDDADTAHDADLDTKTQWQFWNRHNFV